MTVLGLALREIGFILLAVGVIGTIFSYEEYHNHLVGIHGWQVSKIWVAVLCLGCLTIGYSLV